ncbi:acylneuraminate cytidylyltransferase family protein [Azospirillum sp. B21]|nr:acylneuraminate cytidylyltransferase family protein [Azospirillum sp. B21]
MIGSERVMALVTARGGSKRLPGKNLRPLGGRPMIAWTVAAAKASCHIDRVVLSSDDPDIMAAAVAAGCEVPFIRPAPLAADDTPSAAVVHHALTTLDDPCEWLVLLQPTSPLRTASDIDGCLELAHRSGASSAVSVTEMEKPVHFQFWLTAQGTLQPVLGGSVSEAVKSLAGSSKHAHTLNGAVYVVRVEHFLRTGLLFDDASLAYAMPRQRSVDIDTEQDFLLAELLVSCHNSVGS